MSESVGVYCSHSRTSPSSDEYIERIPGVYHFCAVLLVIDVYQRQRYRVTSHRTLHIGAYSAADAAALPSRTTNVTVPPIWHRPV